MRGGGKDRVAGAVGCEPRGDPRGVGDVSMERGPTAKGGLGQVEGGAGLGDGRPGSMGVAQGGGSRHWWWRQGHGEEVTPIKGGDTVLGGHREVSAKVRKRERELGLGMTIRKENDKHNALFFFFNN